MSGLSWSLFNMYNNHKNVWQFNTFQQLWAQKRKKENTQNKKKDKKIVLLKVLLINIYVYIYIYAQVYIQNYQISLQQVHCLGYFKQQYLTVILIKSFKIALRLHARNTIADFNDPSLKCKFIECKFIN